MHENGHVFAASTPEHTAFKALRKPTTSLYSVWVLLATLDKGLRYTQYNGLLVVRAGDAEEDGHVFAASAPEHTAFKALKKPTTS